MAPRGFSILDELFNEQSKGNDVYKEIGKLFAIRHIPLESIIPSPRNEYGMRDIEVLAASIHTMGLMHNIVIRETEAESKYEIISGERRYRAYKLLLGEGHSEYATIPCKVEAKVDDLFAEYLLLQTSATAREHTDYERSYQGIRLKQVLMRLREMGLLKEMQEKGYVLKGRLRDAVAAMMDVSSSQMKVWESIHRNLIPEFMLEFREERIGITAAYDLSTLIAEEQYVALKQYAEDGKDAIRDSLAKTSAQSEVSSFQQQIEDVKNDTESDGCVPPTTVINVQSQKHPRKPNDTSHPTPSKSLNGTEAQYQSLLGLGIEAKLNLSYATKLADKSKYTERLEAFTLVAEAFGFGRKTYQEDLMGMVQQQAATLKNVVI